MIFWTVVCPKQKLKPFRIFLNIEEYGLLAVIPFIKKLTGTFLWEIRILGRENVRILYIARKGKKIILLHGFLKKKKKTPKKEIAIVLERAKKCKDLFTS